MQHPPSPSPPKTPPRTRPPAKRRRTNPIPSPPPSPPPSPSPSPSRSPSPSASPSPSPSASPSASPSPCPKHKWFRRPSVVWYRGNDLRVEDHPALLAAAQRGGPVIPFFVWDPQDGFGTNLGQPKTWWLRESLTHLKNDLSRLGVHLYTRTGRSTQELRRFLEDTGADAVFWNRCYEPDLLKRDEDLRVQLSQEGLTAESFKAELLVEPWELSCTQVAPRFTTFHAYRRAWMTVAPPPHPFPSPSRLKSITHHVRSTDIPHLGLHCSPAVEHRMKHKWKPGSAEAKLQLERFLTEVFPAFGEPRCRRHFDGTSRLSPHIRFGELSPRRMYHATRLRVSRWDQSNTYIPMAPPPPSHLQVPFSSTPPPPTHPAAPVPSSQSPQRHRTPAKDRCSESADATNSDVFASVSTRQQPDDDGAMLDVPSARRDPSSGGSGDEKQSHVSAHADGQPPPSPPVSFVPSTHSYAMRPGYRKRTLPHISISAKAFLKNLCLRDFAYHVLFHSPDFNTKPLIPQFSNFPWAEDNGSFDSWKNAVTGYPIVDAAMRELLETGWIHNGMRFLLACFLTKYLLLPWARGLREFYNLLIDGDRSSNALGWQWTAGSNTDAFPFSCLVNPVKLAYRHDPSGSYVRKWIPELAKLPTQFIHQPWKAPQSLLREAGVDLGSTYPNRIILMSEARSRALDAMMVMKKLFAGSGIMRTLGAGSKGRELVKEWPEQEQEVVNMDEHNPHIGKMSLLPSLWALLQGDPPSAFLSGSSAGSDSLIAFDTASLVEGALAVPLDDQHESIEHALITAHEQPHTNPALSGVGVLPTEDRVAETPSFPLTPNCQMQPEMRSNGVLPYRLEEPLKFQEPILSPDLEQEKTSDVTTRGRNDYRSQSQDVRAVERSSHTMPNAHFHPGMNAMHNGVATAAGMVSMSSGLAMQQQIQQLQQFQQLQSLSMQHGMQQQPQPPVPMQLASTPANHALHVKAAQARQEGRAMKMSHQSQHPILPHHAPQHAVHTPQSHPQIHHPQPHQSVVPPRSQPEPVAPHPSHLHGGVDGVYNPANTGIHANPVAGVPFTGAPMMVGQTSSAPDMNGANHMFGGADPNAALYAHQMGMGPFYGFQPVMPMMNAPHLNGTERLDLLGASAAANSQKLGAQGIMPMGYSVYGGGAFDPAAALGNGFLPPNGNPYPAGVPSSQPQTHPNPAGPYGLPYHPMYIPSPAGVEAMHVSTGQNPLRQPTPTVLHHARQPTGDARSQANQVVPGLATVPTGAADVSISPTCAVHRGVKDRAPDDIQPKTGTAPKENNARAGSAKRSAKSVEVPSSQGQGGRNGAKSNGKGRGGKSKRTAQGQNTGGRNRQDGKGGGRSRGGGASTANQKMSGQTVSCTTTLKARQEILASVLAKEDHEYHGLAGYLSLIYELTGNTDRQTSKDYVRLCNLKDDYHKQCNSDKDKLKIYRIKSFFSKVLKLEVTGEWDRHNHGGVRGPYVYGIRLKKQAEASVESTKMDES